MKIYQKFRNSSLDTSPLGLIVGSDTSSSAFTPADSRILAWLTHDSNIHFCQIDSLGDLVFVVDPSASPGDCILPVANSLCEFIGLLKHCKDASIIAYAYRWSKTYFDAQVDAIKTGMKARSVLRALENCYHPPVIQDAYQTILSLQTQFDYSKIPLQPDYFEWCPIRPGTIKWEVGMDTYFADYCERGCAGKELPVRRDFSWQHEMWSVPAIYLCENGIVVDTYMEVTDASIRNFMSKWDHRSEETLSAEDKMNRQLEDPMAISATGTLLVNDKPFQGRSQFTLCWNPLEENTWQARRTLEHYHLDRSKGYLFRREFFHRKSKNPPIRTMQLSLMAEPVSVPGERFVAPEQGKQLSFTHPDTAVKHTLTVLSETREALDPNFLSNHPCCYTRLVYDLEPPLAWDDFSITDCDPGDPWEGNVDGPSAVFISGKKNTYSTFALSSLRHAPAERITWRMIFKRQLRDIVQVRLLP